MSNLKILGERIRYYRRLNNMTQKELAAKLGVAPRYIGNIEQGHRGPSLDMLVELCKRFNIGLSDILPIEAGLTEEDKLIGEIVDALRTMEPSKIGLVKSVVSSMQR